MSFIPGALTDEELRASPVPVEGPLTDEELRASPVENVPKGEYYQEVMAGRVPGRDVVHIFGRNPNISPGDGFAPVWSGGNATDYPGFNATAAEVVEIFSDDAADNAAGTGARTVVFTGLDIDYNTVTEVVALNGTTPVDTVNTYLRWSITFVLSAGSNGKNVGNITARQKLTPANVFCHIVPETNRALATVLTVPAGKLYYANKRFATLSRKGNASCEVQVWARVPGTVFQVFEWWAISGSGSSFVDIGFEAPLIAVPAGTDLYIAMNTDTNNTGVSAGAEFIVEDAT
jgi:hypothetical protein